jgi:hypothetical protein
VVNEVSDEVSRQPLVLLLSSYLMIGQRMNGLRDARMRRLIKEIKNKGFEDPWFVAVGAVSNVESRALVRCLPSV